MSITDFFCTVLGANLTNPRWSWGAIDPINNRVFLRVWNDQVREIDGIKVVQVYWSIKRSKSLGYNERLAQLNRIEQGAEAVGILCTAKDTKTSGIRKIKSFQQDPLLLLRNVINQADGMFMEIHGTIALDDLKRQQTAESTLAYDLRALFKGKNVGRTTQEALVDARIGQGGFRKSVLKIWGAKCAVTGSETLDAIRASHIRPWRHSSNEQRLDPFNGLPLTANLDALFDAGLISFDDQGSMLVSNDIPEAEKNILGLSDKKLRFIPDARTLKYLEYHRSNILR